MISIPVSEALWMDGNCDYLAHPAPYTLPGQKPPPPRAKLVLLA